MPIKPSFCPRRDCPSHSGAPFLWRHRGFFRRLCDRRFVQRFLCLCCQRSFSEQTLRVDYRLKRPELLAPLFLDRISKVTHRQSARIRPCARTTEERHFRRLALHCQAFHASHLSQIPALCGVGHTFLLDELETYEQHRILKPVTVPVLIEIWSGFVLQARVGTLPPRGRRDPFLESALAKQVAREGVRKSESRREVWAAFERLRECVPRRQWICVRTDEKQQYVHALRSIFGERCVHERTPSTRRRDISNRLWRINHTLARMRDGISRLVRETWAAAKKREWLAGQIAIWVCYRNYVRGKRNKEPRTTPAMALGLDQRRWKVHELLERRIFEWH